jgi:hypothetical protein
MPSADAHQQSLTDLNLTYRPQREWIEGRGLLVVAAHFFSGVGAGPARPATTAMLMTSPAS